MSKTTITPRSMILMLTLVAIICNMSLGIAIWSMYDIIILYGVGLISGTMLATTGTLVLSTAVTAYLGWCVIKLTEETS